MMGRCCHPAVCRQTRSETACCQGQLVNGGPRFAVVASLLWLLAQATCREILAEPQLSDRTTHPTILVMQLLNGTSSRQLSRPVARLHVKVRNITGALHSCAHVPHHVADWPAPQQSLPKHVAVRRIRVFPICLRSGVLCCAVVGQHAEVEARAGVPAGYVSVRVHNVAPRRGVVGRG